ncbi:hypothetical protein SKAU_G00288310 [Synaphobranchus kaupii]|uniref:Uncharacterized protein n=1 Tax=Synaphobranchus kaupii TaxID=118154 RepID=A0A9Q1IM18_SYNKA|nr:hypothetical protein SKAU_G00288310 [Synaphobranchus kaupii]
MDPADPAHVRIALEQQGAMLGRHQAHLDTVTQHLQTLSSCVAELTSALRTSAPGIVPQQPPVQTPPGFQPTPPREPRLPPPEKYAAWQSPAKIPRQASSPPAVQHLCRCHITAGASVQCLFPLHNL